MNQFRLFAITAMLLGSLCLWAQNSTGAADAGPQQHGQMAAQNSPEAVDQHLQALTRQLDLTPGQQAKIRPVLQRMFDERQKIAENASLSPEARHQKETAARQKAEKQARPILNDDQKKKLDELELQEQQQHPHS